VLLCLDAAYLGKGRVTGVVGTNDACGSPCLSQEGKPDPASQPGRVGASSRDRGCNLSIAQEEGGTKLPLAKVIMDVVTSNSMEGVLGAEPFI